MRRTTVPTAAVLLSVAMAACSQRAKEPAAVELTAAERAGYLPAPEVTQVVRAPGGGLMVHGRSKPGGRIRATTPSGEAYGATAGADGRFAVELPAMDAALLASVSVEERGRSTLAEGWLFVPPAEPSRAALLRPGAAAWVFGSEPGLLAAVDYDADGGAGVSGKADPDAEVRVLVDGAPAGQVQADAQGRYSLRLNRVAPGEHTIRVIAGDETMERTLALGVSAPAQTYFAVRQAGGWRVDWTTPGGGLQSTVIVAGTAAS